MKVREHPELLHRLFDGDLDSDTADAVRRELAESPEGREQLEWLEVMREAIAEPVRQERSEVRLDSLWAGIEARLDAEDLAAEAARAPAAVHTPAAAHTRAATREPARKSWWQRTSEQLRQSWTFSPLWMAAGAAAAVAIGFATWGTLGDAPETGLAPPAVTLGKAHNNQAYVSSLEVDSGFVIIDQMTSDPTQPLIVWHIEDDESDLNEGFEANDDVDAGKGG